MRLTINVIRLLLTAQNSAAKLFWKMDETPKPPLPEVPPPQSVNREGWGCGMKLLWGYTLLIVCGTIVGCLSSPYFPPEPAPVEQQLQDSVLGAFLFLPAVIFVILMGIKNLRR